MDFIRFTSERLLYVELDGGPMTGDPFILKVTTREVYFILRVTASEVYIKRIQRPARKNGAEGKMSLVTMSESPTWLGRLLPTRVLGLPA